MGRIVTIVDNQRYDFIDVTGTAKVKLPLATRVDVGAAKRARLLVRVYRAEMPATLASLTVEAYQAWPTAEDAQEYFELAGADRAPIVVLKGKIPSVSTADPRPTIVIVDDDATEPKVAEYVGPTLDVYLIADRGGAASTAFNCGITVALELWDA